MGKQIFYYAFHVCLDVSPFGKNKKNHKDRMNQLNLTESSDTRKGQRIKKGSQIVLSLNLSPLGLVEESFLSPKRVRWSP